MTCCRLIACFHRRWSDCCRCWDNVTQTNNWLSVLQWKQCTLLAASEISVSHLKSFYVLILPRSVMWKALKGSSDKSGIFTFSYLQLCKKLLTDPFCVWSLQKEMLEC